MYNHHQLLHPNLHSPAQSTGERPLRGQALFVRPSTVWHSQQHPLWFCMTTKAVTFFSLPGQTKGKFGSVAWLRTINKYIYLYLHNYVRGVLLNCSHWVSWVKRFPQCGRKCVNIMKFYFFPGAFWFNAMVGKKTQSHWTHAGFLLHGFDLTAWKQERDKSFCSLDG